MKDDIPASRRARPHTERWAYRWLYTPRVFQLTTALFPLLGRQVFHMVSRSVAAFYHATQPGVAEVVRANLGLLGVPLGRRAAGRVFRNFATVISDYVALGAMKDEDAFKFCGEFKGREWIDQALSERRGAVLATGHFGFFEFGAVVLGSLGMPATVATLPEPSPGLTAWRAAWRERWGVITVEVGQDPFAAIGLHRALAERRLVAVLADRPVGESGVRIRLPGGATRFSIVPAALALVTGAPIIPVAVTLRPDGLYRVEAMAPLVPKRVPQGGRAAEIERLTSDLAHGLLTAFSQAPEQWFQFVPVSCD